MNHLLDLLGYDAWSWSSHLDHAGDFRTSEIISAVWSEPGSRIVDIDGKGRFCSKPFGRPTAGEWQPGAFLGTVEGVAWFARRVDDIPDGVTLRDAELDTVQTQIAAKASAIVNWQRATCYCERCGGETRLAADGFSAMCSSCGRNSFPRTDPAVIVAVVDSDDRLFLAHQGSWESGRVSILAGFVESGESAEHAVYREVREESGVEVSALKYLWSQPWPFPRSLMLGYVARGAGQSKVDGIELEWGTWFTRENLDLLLATGKAHLPKPASISRQIIEAWRLGVLPNPEDTDNAGV